MKISNIASKISATTFLTLSSILLFAHTNAFAATAEDCDPTTGKMKTDPTQACISAAGLPFRIPTFSEILTFAIRAIFVFGGLAALLFLLLGAFSWITSGGEKDKVAEAQKKIQAAVLGVIMIAVVLAIVVTLEQVIFGGKICLGLSCPITIPTLVK